MNQKQKTELRPGSGVRPGKLTTITAAAMIFLATSSLGQVVLTGTNYTQSFNDIGAGLPAGWSVRTNATTGGLGTAATFNGTPVSWGSTAGQFANYAAAVSDFGTNFLGSESAGVQSATANRCLAVRQVGAFGDPGAAFVVQIANTIGITNLLLSLQASLLDVEERSTIWTVDYAVGNPPSSFTPLATFNDPGAFGATPLAGLSLNADADDQSENVWIRIVALGASSGSNSRDTLGIDNFSLTYSNVNAAAAVPLGIQIVGNNAVLTWSNSDFKLQAGPAPAGVFTNVPNAVSPQAVPIDQSRRFFRLVNP
jgi:hypothetical protein